MKILRDPANTSPCVLVLGTFDGVHRGHQALLMAGNDLAEKYHLPLNVCTFEPHPLQVLRPEVAPPLLTTLPERAALMAGFGVENLCVTTFTKQVAAQEPEAYLQDLFERYHPKALVCGFNHTFGAYGRGNGETIRHWCAAHDCEAVIVPNVVLDGATVSSTRIRGLLEAGQITEATRLMGHWYTMSGKVMDGKHIGRTMGYPTANMEPPKGKVFPAYGVYACYLTAEEKIYPAVVNVGRHPTLPEGNITVEAHVLDACLMLYGKKIRLDFLRFQRPEHLFSGVEELKVQITRDAADAKAYFDSLR